jgi:opacity protein-like surface antigen
MLNKYVLILALALAPVFSAPALPEFGLSAGGGLSLGGLFTRYTITADENTRYGPTFVRLNQGAQQFNFGGYLFFDATYAELSVDIQGGVNSYKETARMEQGGDTVTNRKGTGSETMLGFTLLGKYPFTLRKGLLLYPLAGIEYQIALAEKRKPEEGSERDRTEGAIETEFEERNFSLSMWNSFFIDIGAGVDFEFRSPFYARAEFLYSFRLQTPYETAAIEWLMDTYGISEPTLWGDPKMSGLTHGPELRLAVGYRFK